MSELFTAEFFSANRAHLRELFMGTAPMVVTANGLLQRSGDTAFAFQQDPNFWYLTGVDEPDAILVMDKARDYLIVPFKEGVRAQFDGQVTPEELAAMSGIEHIYGEKEGWKLLAARLGKSKHVATIAPPPRYIDTYGMYSNPARERLVRHMKEHGDELELLDIAPHMAKLRMVKQPLEIQAIQRAIDITSATIKQLTRPSNLAKYAYEYEIEADLYRGFRRAGSEGHAFDPIVAAGKNAATVHYMANNAPLHMSDLLTLDVGAAYDHYAADITRTVSLGGKPSKRQRAVYDAVADVQQYAYGLLKPGVLLADYEHEVETYMGEKLRALGLIKTIERDQVRRYYPHAASHHLGLNVHDVDMHDRVLEENMIITVEPGIYIPEEGIGVRIEDDVRITETGIEILTRALPAKLV